MKLTASYDRPWRVVHIDLSEGVPSLPDEHGTGGVYLVVWWRDIPLCQLDLMPDQLPIPAGHLRALVMREIVPTVGYHVLGQAFAPERVPGATPRRPRTWTSSSRSSGPSGGWRRSSWIRSKGRRTFGSVVVCT